MSTQAERHAAVMRHKNPRASYDHLPDPLVAVQQDQRTLADDFQGICDELATAQTEVERLAWNLAGCLTIAESQTPTTYNREMATPALDAVNRMALLGIECEKSHEALEAELATANAQNLAWIRWANKSGYPHEEMNDNTTAGIKILYEFHARMDTANAEAAAIRDKHRQLQDSANGRLEHIGQDGLQIQFQNDASLLGPFATGDAGRDTLAELTLLRKLGVLVTNCASTPQLIDEPYWRNWFIEQSARLQAAEVKA